MGVKSLGNTLATFGYKFGGTGNDTTGDTSPTPEIGMSASGGTAIMYESGGTYYKTHIFQ